MNSETRAIQSFHRGWQERKATLQDVGDPVYVYVPDPNWEVHFCFSTSRLKQYVVRCQHQFVDAFDSFDEAASAVTG